MRVIAFSKLREFFSQHATIDSEKPLRQWFKVVEKTDWSCFGDLRTTFSSADQVGQFSVFNIAGNKYRLIAVVHFDTGKVYVRHIMPHKEYDLGNWKNDTWTDNRKKKVPGRSAKPRGSALPRRPTKE